MFGVGVAMQKHGNLGLPPWDVFHDGFSSIIDLSFGHTIVATSALVMLLWIPLRQMPGLGTLINAQGYDVFIYDNSGTLTLEALEWSNATVTMTIASPTVLTTTEGYTNGDIIYLNTNGKSINGFGKEPLQTLTTGVSLLTTVMSVYLILTRL